MAEFRVQAAPTQITVDAKIAQLISYCRANDWAGYDPYDALNSLIFRQLPWLDCRLPRLVFTQVLKRSPVNFRRWLHVPKTHNPKAMALFLSSFLTLERVSFDSLHGGDIDLMVERLCNLRSPGTDYWCWGYSFPWQTRTMIVPAGAPNLVCTSFVANALLDAYDRHQESRLLSMALSAVEYILSELYWTDAGVAGFSYPVPSLRVQVHNANFLAAALLCRAYKYTGDKKFLSPALEVARQSAAKQRADGSWYYGEAVPQRWIDNFHTGYNLCALNDISRFAATTEFKTPIRRGFEFYRKHFFREGGSVKYFHNRNYPIDTHCVAQSILTLVAFKDLDPSSLEIAQSVLQWALAHLWDEKGFFYHRIMRSCTSRISYIRWSQAWMLLAMSKFLEVSMSSATVDVSRNEVSNKVACASQPLTT